MCGWRRALHNLHRKLTVATTPSDGPYGGGASRESENGGGSCEHRNSNFEPRLFEIIESLQVLSRRLPVSAPSYLFPNPPANFLRPLPIYLTLTTFNHATDTAHRRQLHRHTGTSKRNSGQLIARLGCASISSSHDISADNRILREYE